MNSLESLSRAEDVHTPQKVNATKSNQRLQSSALTSEDLMQDTSKTIILPPKG